MIKKLLLLFILLSSRAYADGNERWQDFIVVRDRTMVCIDAATTYADAAACAGKASRECHGEEGDWPHPEPRTCRHEISVWSAIYRNEFMAQLEYANKLDMQYLVDGSTLFTGNLNAAMQAEQAWSAYAGSICRVEDLILAELTYDERQALPQTFCMERQYAERIFYLRSERNWLNYYRKGE
jgi:hypothetical protein